MYSRYVVRPAKSPSACSDTTSNSSPYPSAGPPCEKTNPVATNTSSHWALVPIGANTSTAQIQAAFHADVFNSFMVNRSRP